MENKCMACKKVILQCTKINQILYYKILLLTVPEIFQELGRKTKAKERSVHNCT